MAMALSRNLRNLGWLGLGAITAAAWHLGSGRTREPLDRRVVLITGGSRGLGLALAERFGRAGGRLVLIARDKSELERAKALLVERGAVANAGDILLFSCDVRDAVEAHRAVEEAISGFGRLDVLINNAGVIEVGPVEDQPLEAYERAMQTNFFAALHTIQAALPHMLARRGERDRAIVNIASIGGKFAMPHLLPYVASKFALVGFSEGLHAELRHKGVRVTTVCPGLMRTGSHAQAEFAGDREKEYRWFAVSATTPGVAAAAGDAAEKIYRAVSAGRAEITITPQAWLAARLVGVAPEMMQSGASLISHLLLPDPAGNRELRLGFDVRKGASGRVRKIEESQNQHRPPIGMDGALQPEEVEVVEG